jgi:hypothetical protein
MHLFFIYTEIVNIIEFYMKNGRFNPNIFRVRVQKIYLEFYILNLFLNCIVTHLYIEVH